MHRRQVRHLPRDTVPVRSTSSGPDPSAAAVFGLKAAAMTALDAMYHGDLVTCITCGAIYEVG